MTKAELEHIMNTLGLTKTELALKMGVTPKTVTNWCKGQTMPPVNVLALKYLMVEGERNSKCEDASLTAKIATYERMLEERDKKIRELELLCGKIKAM